MDYVGIVAFDSADELLRYALPMGEIEVRFGPGARTHVSGLGFVVPVLPLRVGERQEKGVAVCLDPVWRGKG
eukprot:5453453-Pleurochrysis_carterae.AAC.2